MFDIPEANAEVAQKLFQLIFIVREVSVLQMYRGGRSPLRQMAGFPLNSAGLGWGTVRKMD